MIAKVGAELVLHGHNHIGSVATVMGPAKPVPVIGAPSASSRGGTLTHPAGYFMFTITETEGRFAIAAEHRGLTPQGTIGDLGVLPLS